MSLEFVFSVKCIKDSINACIAVKQLAIMYKNNTWVTSMYVCRKLAILPAAEHNLAKHGIVG